jgi:hypothetical protein
VVAVVVMVKPLTHQIKALVVLVVVVLVVLILQALYLLLVLPIRAAAAVAAGCLQTKTAVQVALVLSFFPFQQQTTQVQPQAHQLSPQVAQTQF